MLSLETTYLNMRLRSPLVVSASPLSLNIENIKRMEAAGAGAVVLFSLFEEQVRNEQRRHEYFEAHPKATEANAATLYPEQQFYHLTVEEYLAHIRKAKESVGIPIIASLNAQSLGGWSECAQQIEAAGADALELNIYDWPTDMDRTADQIESNYLQILKVARESVKIPLAVKLTPFFTNVG
ncbi:MAG: dihydroorotate dehydrogenase-like protein, partial [Anaerolineae bacterium]